MLRAPEIDHAREGRGLRRARWRRVLPPEISRGLVRVVFSTALVALAGACAAETELRDHDDDGAGETAEPLGSASSALSATDPVSTAVLQSCSTTAVKGLATQLVEEIQCLRPNTMKRIDNVAGLKLGAAVFPYLQTPAADALSAAQKARGVTMSINSGLRTLPQQFLLYRWYKTGRCGIGLAATPGTSNHESAIAVDIEDNAAWRSALQGKSFRWLGASDPVHYDFTGAGAVDLRGLSVKAFQRLWNRNHPEDPIPEDSAYGTQTADRLAKAPSGGFPKGADCKEAPASTPGSADDAPPITPSSTPDATEPADAPATETSDGAHEADDATNAGSGRLRSGAQASSGCAFARAREHTTPIASALLVVAMATLLLRRRGLRSGGLRSD